MGKITIEIDKLKNIVNEVIKNEFMTLSEYNYKDLENLDGYYKLHESIIELENTLKSALPQELKEVLDQYINIALDIKYIENEYFYNAGAKAGVNKLSFLKDTIVINHM